MPFEIALVAVIAGLVWWLLVRKRKRRRWDPGKQEPGEQWKIVEFRRYAKGFVYLCQSEDDGHWIVHEVPSQDETARSRIARHMSEKEARAAFTRIATGQNGR